jgi:hypothetical protein
MRSMLNGLAGPYEGPIPNGMTMTLLVGEKSKLEHSNRYRHNLSLFADEYREQLRYSS